MIASQRLAGGAPALQSAVIVGQPPRRATAPVALGVRRLSRAGSGQAWHRSSVGRRGACPTIRRHCRATAPVAGCRATAPVALGVRRRSHAGSGQAWHRSSVGRRGACPTIRRHCRATAPVADCRATAPVADAFSSPSSAAPGHACSSPASGLAAGWIRFALPAVLPCAAHIVSPSISPVLVAKLSCSSPSRCSALR